MDMNIFRKFGSKKNSKGVSGESSDSDLHPRRLAEVWPSEWPHTPFLQEAGIFEEFTQYIANAGLTDFITDECDQLQILTNIFVQSFTFLPRNDPPEVSFDLYAENHQIPLTEFCDICMISSDGSLAEPRPAEDFCRILTVGDERRVSAITAGGLHFPVVRYFSLFITKCLLVVLRRALEGDNTHSLGAIVARRLHLNKSMVKYIVGFLLPVWQLTSRLRYALMITL